jgi:hypothetical protein
MKKINWRIKIREINIVKSIIEKRAINASLVIQSNL